MRFSIQEQNEKKMFFHSPAAANKVTGLHLTTIKTILERGGNPTYHRKSDNKLFEIRKEDPIKILEIEGEDFFSLEEIQAKFGLSPTKFLNQVKNDQFAKKIDWISPELFPGNESETEKIDERSEAELALEVLREQFEKYQAEMRSQFEKYQAEMSNLHAEISRLSAKVETLEASLASRPAEVSPPPQEKIFKSKTVFPLDSFNINSIARFIRKGIVGKIQPSGPKTKRKVLIDGREEYLPDLVEQIIRDHIVPVMENETQEEKTKRLNGYMESKGKKIDGLTFGELSALRRGLRTLDPMVIVDISKELMKLI